MNTSDMTAKMAAGNGFIAALDQSGGSTPKALAGYGIEAGAWGSEEEMFGLIHDMRSRIIRSTAFTGEKVIGAILFERTMDGTVDGVPTPAALIAKGVVPFIKIDKGLEDEANGVQLMKPMPDLDALLVKAKALGVYGTKERSVINSANAEGIAAIVAQQFEVGRQVLSHGMMPMLEPEINIKSETRSECDEIMLGEILKNLEGHERAGDAQAVAAGAARSVRSADQPPQGAARRRAVGRLQAARGLRRAVEEQRHHRQLQPRAARGPALPDERRRIRRRTGQRDRRYPQGFDAEGVKAEVRVLPDISDLPARNWRHLS